MMAVEIRENDFLPQMEMCKLESLFIPILCIWPKHILPSRFCQLRVGFVFFICSLQLNSLSIVHGVRCRDKQRKESSRLQAVNRKLTAMNKLLMEENERLQKQVSQLVHENAYMKQQLQNVSLGFVNDKPYYNILLFVEVHTYLVAHGGSCLPLIPLYAACSLH